jgi:transposase
MQPARWREDVDAILYVNRAGCTSRTLPHDLAVSWSATHKHLM